MKNCCKIRGFPMVLVISQRTSSEKRTRARVKSVSRENKNPRSFLAWLRLIVDEFYTRNLPFLSFRSSSKL